MRLSILHNRDHDLLEEDPGREARKDVTRVAAELARALTARRHEVSIVAVGENTFSFLETLRETRPDLVVNLCESLVADSRGEMAVPALLELLRLPYTGSSALSLGLALHKDKAKELLFARGVPTPEFELVERLEDLVTVNLPFPLIVKPAREDASVGVNFDSVVSDKRSLGRAAGYVLRTLKQPAIVERYVAGREIYVPILGNQPRRTLPLTEIHFGRSFEDRPNIVTYRAKWDRSSVECTDSPALPCALEPDVEKKVVQTALAAFAALDCRDYGRVDIRLTPEGKPFVIDINPNCDLHPESGFAKAATAAGIDYPSLAWRLVEIAVERNHGNPSAHLKAPGTARRAVGADRNVHPRRSLLRARADRSRASAKQR